MQGDQACYDGLAELGIDVWLPLDWQRVPSDRSQINISAEQSAQVKSAVEPAASEHIAQRGMKRATESVVEPIVVESVVEPIIEKQAPPSSSSSDSNSKPAASLRYSLLLQPVGEHVMLLCELEDPDAPSLSSHETQLLSGILKAVSARLLSGQPIAQSHNIFRWPVSSEASRSALFSDPLFAYKALEGLLSGQSRRGVKEFIFLGDQLSDLVKQIESVGSLHDTASLSTMAAGDRAAKGALWALLQTLLG